MAKPGTNMRAPIKPKSAKKSLKRIFSYFKKRKLSLVIVAICIAISALAEVAQSYFIRPIINDYIVPFIGDEKVDYTGLINICVFMFVIVLLGGITGYIYNIIMVKIASSTLLEIRTELFSKLEKLPIKYYDTNQNGDIMSRFTNDIDTLREMLGRTIPQFISTIISVSGVFIMMIVLNWRLTIIVVGMLFIMLTFISLVGKASGKNFKRQQEEVGKANAYIEEMMSGSKVVKVFCYEKRARDRFDEINEDLRKASSRAHVMSSILRPIMANLSNISYVLTATIGTIMVVNKTFDIGGLGSYIKYVKSFSMPITNLSEQFNNILMAIAGAERIFEVLDESEEVNDGYVTLVNVERDSDGKLIERNFYTGMWAWKHPHSKTNTVTYTELKGEVVFENVTFGYEEGKNILKNLNLNANPGEKIAFVGSTGAGKTTITNLINRFYDVNKGKIRYDGINVKKIKKEDLRKSLAMVLQDTHLFTGTVKDNIRFGKLDATDEEIIAAAKIANAHQFIMHLPDGYDTVLTGDGANLSQGQRQLLAIARAAIANPPVLILDEATSSIDTRTESLIEKGMDTLMKGRTVFVIAHRLSTVRNADNIVVLEHGEIIESGNHHMLMEKKGKYYELQKGLFELS